MRIYLFPQQSSLANYSVLLVDKTDGVAFGPLKQNNSHSVVFLALKTTNYSS